MLLPRPLLFIAPLGLVSGAVSSAAVPAQWGADPAVNQVISSAPSDQNQPKLAPTPDGGFWVSWLDGIGTGWDVRLQKLDASGAEVFGPGGLLVADRGFSSTQDYGLGVAENGDALLAFRDDRTGSVQISAARVTGSGGFPWGPAGVTLTSGGAFVAAPKIVESARSAGGQAVVAWTENSNVRLQALTASGQTAWVGGVTLGPAAGNYGLADLERLDEDVVVSIVHQTGGFISPRHLLAQRLDPGGAALWGAAPVTVFGAGSLQIGNFPAMEISGGDAVFAWYSSSPSLQCFVQRLDGAGAPRFQAGGLSVATAPGRDRVNPRAAVDAGSGDLLVSWTEQASSSSLSGISAQRVSLTGSRLWGSSGVAIVPLGPAVADFPGIQVAAGHSLFTWLEAPSFGSDRRRGHAAVRCGVDAEHQVTAGPRGGLDQSGAPGLERRAFRRRRHSGPGAGPRRRARSAWLDPGLDVRGGPQLHG